MMPNVTMRCVLRSHYDTKRNAESPEYAWPDAIHDGVELDDAMQLQMFEVSRAAAVPWMPTQFLAPYPPHVLLY
jgi:hypothetical protein